MPENNDLLVWVDIETSGLDEKRDYLLEVGFRVTDLDFNEVSRISRVCHYPARRVDSIRSRSVEFVQNLHDGNGLWADCVGATDAPEVEEELMEWVNAEGIDGNPLCGSSLALDRKFLEEWMPDLHHLFHYRSIDNSSTKELCKRYNPDLYSRLPEFETDHRVDTCLDGTIAEAKFYVENFFFEGDTRF